MNTEALIKFLVEINTATTSVMVAYSYHALLFFTLSATVILYFLYRRFKHNYIYRWAITFLAGVLLGYGITSLPPQKMYKYWTGGATSINIKNPDTGLDAVSERVIADLYTIYKEHTVYDNSTKPVLTKEGEELLQKKTYEYIAIQRDAKGLQIYFPLFYLSIMCGVTLLIFLPIVSGFSQNKITKFFEYAYLVSLACAGFLLLAYPVHYYIFGEPMHAVGLIYSVTALVLCFTNYKQK